ncbi:hypothetical protein ACFOW1_03730 [Parasediminibacterium paludis]|uniref:Uncharacterized protein n=1 Tax=Parasediminibacterium paludis TaxID=908966 RepID=A0ABV8PVE4_9BACT
MPKPKQPTLRIQAHLQGTQNPTHRSQPCKRANMQPSQNDEPYLSRIFHNNILTQEKSTTIF